MLQGPHFWFQVQSIVARDEGDQRYEDGTWLPDRYEHGEWLPPRPKRYNVRNPADTRGAWYLFHQGRVTFETTAPDPDRVTHYKTFSFYVNNRRIWIYRCNALQYDVGDSRQEPPFRPTPEPPEEESSSAEENEGSDGLEVGMNDVLEDWREISFNSHTYGVNGLASFATVRGQQDVLCAQRTNQRWPTEVLPPRYHRPQPLQTNSISHGGLMTEIPTKIALVAYSVPPARVSNALLNNFQNTYVSSGPLGGGCKYLDRDAH